MANNRSMWPSVGSQKQNTEKMTFGSKMEPTNPKPLAPQNNGFLRPLCSLYRELYTLLSRLPVQIPAAEHGGHVGLDHPRALGDAHQPALGQLTGRQLWVAVRGHDASRVAVRATSGGHWRSPLITLRAVSVETATFKSCITLLGGV